MTNVHPLTVDRLIRWLSATVLALALASTAAAHPHTVCKQGSTTVVEGDSKWKQGLQLGWWTDGPCPEPEPPPPVPEPPPPAPAPPPKPAPLPASTIKPGPRICKAFADVGGADLLVFTNVTDRPSRCNVWRYRLDGKLDSTAELELEPREKRVVSSDEGFLGWWRVNCTEPWKGARLRGVVDGPIVGVPEREATACLE